MKTQQNKNTPRRASRRGAFTLLELIAVMGIIVTLSSVVVAGVGSIIRMISEKSATDILVKAIKLTRQHACVDGRDTYLYIIGQESYVICRRSGVITRTVTGSLKHPNYESEVSARWVFDEFADLSVAKENWGAGLINNNKLQYKGIKIFDLTAGRAVELQYDPFYYQQGGEYAIGLPMGTAKFAQGNVYGWVVYPPQMLPKGYAFQVSKNGAFVEEQDLETHPRYIMFDASGNASGNPGMEIFVKKLGSDDKEASFVVSVDTKGKITIDDY